MSKEKKVPPRGMQRTTRRTAGSGSHAFHHRATVVLLFYVPFACLQAQGRAELPCISYHSPAEVVFLPLRVWSVGLFPLYSRACLCLPGVELIRTWLQAHIFVYPRPMSDSKQQVVCSPVRWFTPDPSWGARRWYCWESQSASDHSSRSLRGQHLPLSWSSSSPSRFDAALS